MLGHYCGDLIAFSHWTRWSFITQECSTAQYWQALNPSICLPNTGHVECGLMCWCLRSSIILAMLFYEDCTNLCAQLEHLCLQWMHLKSAEWMSGYFQTHHTCPLVVNSCGVKPTCCCTTCQLQIGATV